MLRNAQIGSKATIRCQKGPKSISHEPLVDLYSLKKGNLNQDRPVFSFQIRLKVKVLISCANYCPFILILITLNEDACIVKKAQEGILSQLSLLSCYEWILMGRCAVYKNSAIFFHKTSCILLNRIFHQVSKIYTARNLCIIKVWLNFFRRAKFCFISNP